MLGGAQVCAEGAGTLETASGISGVRWERGKSIYIHIESVITLMSALTAAAAPIAYFLFPRLKHEPPGSCVANSALRRENTLWKGARHQQKLRSVEP